MSFELGESYQGAEEIYVDPVLLHDRHNSRESRTLDSGCYEGSVESIPFHLNHQFRSIKDKIPSPHNTLPRKKSAIEYSMDYNDGIKTTGIKPETNYIGLSSPSQVLMNHSKRKGRKFSEKKNISKCGSDLQTDQHVEDIQNRKVKANSVQEFKPVEKKKEITEKSSYFEISPYTERKGIKQTLPGKLNEKVKKYEDNEKENKRAKEAPNSPLVRSSTFTKREKDNMNVKAKQGDIVLDEKMRTLEKYELGRSYFDCKSQVFSMTSSYKEVRAKRSQIPVNLKEEHDDNNEKVLSEQEKRWKTRQDWLTNNPQNTESQEKIVPVINLRPLGNDNRTFDRPAPPAGRRPRSSHNRNVLDESPQRIQDRLGVNAVEKPARTSLSYPSPDPGCMIGSPEFNITQRHSPFTEQEQSNFKAVVAIDFGTTYSGYAYALTKEPEKVHIMRKWEGNDPGVNNPKTPTILLLSPEQEFHSYGYTARDYYHDLDHRVAQKWFYFEKFKMILHHNKYLGRNTMIPAANGKDVTALKIFSIVLRYFKEHALQELRDFYSTKLLTNDLRWVVTVPAIWRQQAKQFMREAAYQAGLGSAKSPEQLLLALEPEAASVYCRKLRQSQLVPETKPGSVFSFMSPSQQDSATDEADDHHVLNDIKAGGSYMLVDCGGGTVDITVHEIALDDGQHLKEVFKATGGPYGSVEIDEAFLGLLSAMVGDEFLQSFKKERPAGFIDLMIAFESRKRCASPNKFTPLSVALPFSFIDYYRKFYNKDIGEAVNKFGSRYLKWSSEGMLRMDIELMKQLFMPSINKIIQHIRSVISEEEQSLKNVDHLILVGGFSESQLLQQEIRTAFKGQLKVIIPQGVCTAVLQGAVMYGLDPTIIKVRRAKLTYGIGVIKPFQQEIHPRDKLIKWRDEEWCMDIFDKFVVAGQSIGQGEIIQRLYRPATSDQETVVLHIFATESDDPSQNQFVSSAGVYPCGSLVLCLSKLKHNNATRNIKVCMKFGDTEVQASAKDMATNEKVETSIQFLNHSNTKYTTKL